MPIKLTPVSNAAPKNTLKVKLEFMHGDADAYTHTESTVKIPEDANKEELIGKILQCIKAGLGVIADCDSPFVISDGDWNSTNCDEETGIPLVGARLQFLNIVHHQYWSEQEILIGTVSKATEDVVTLEFNGSVFEVLNDEDNIAPESAITLIVDGYDGYFKIGEVEVRFEGDSDSTCEGEAASGSINEVVYYDANGSKFQVSGY